MPFVVVFKHREDGDILYLGEPGLCVNSGVRTSSRTVVNLKDARRFMTMRAAKPFTECNRFWECAVKRVEV